MKISLPNVIAVRDGSTAPPEDDAFDDLFEITEQRVAIVERTRSAGRAETVDVGDDDIVEITLEDGTRWFLDADELDELARERPDVARGGAAATDAIALEELLFAEPRSRGIVGSAIRKLRVLAVRLRDALDTSGAEGAVGAEGAGRLASLAIDPLAHGIAHGLEKRLIGDAGSRLCRVDFTESRSGVVTPALSTIDALPAATAGEPTLLLVHGTLSSTTGSFGELWNTRTADLARLRARFGTRIYAFEHRTLTESPVDNALQIAKALPPSIELHLLSHSRGGLVGELLCRGTRDGVSAFSPDEIEMFELQRDAARDRLDLSANLMAALRNHYTEELARLRELDEVLGEKRLVVSGFVRVGCPARGTTLASGRLHRWSNRSLNAIGLLTGQKTNPLYRAFEGFTLGMLKANTKAEVLPGLQAQMPDSALIHLLNATDGAPLLADLAVVAGDLDAAGGLNWKRLPVWFTDRFYGGDNDLVVNTASMDGGGIRRDGLRLLRVEGEHVNHFAYFANADSCTQLVNYLVGERTPAFRPTERRDDVTIARGRRLVHTGRRPVLVLVPGILGSELKQDGERIWAHAGRLLLGRINDLRIGADDVTADDVIDLAYGRFVRHFGATHDVHVAPYDWRLSLGDAAAVLAGRLEHLLDAQDDDGNDHEVQPIRLVAHSMGGLVTRTLIATHPRLWARITARPGSRFIMAGTPTNGSYTINRIVAGEDRMIRLLALADLRNSPRDLAELVAAFPGVATMLPGFGELDWLHASTWRDLEASVSGRHWSLISEPLLALAREERRRLLHTPLDPAFVSYVAGRSEERTVADAFVDTSRDGTIGFRYTHEGDGRVTWKSGIPDGLVNVHYQHSAHGSLLDAPEHFEAWTELLDSGTTRRLPREAPAVPRARGIIDPLARSDEPEALDYLPDPRTLLGLALGMEPAPSRSDAPGATIRVRIDHGDLAFATHPVVVGHHEGEAIVGTEAALDRALDGRLLERHRIGQYPGREGTSAVILTPSNNDYPEGALVVGLGEQGELTAAKLERSLTASFIDYLLEVRDWWARHRPDESRTRTAALSTLLIGTGIGSLSVHDCVGVILKSALAANRACRETNLANATLLDELVLIEIWQDLALQAAGSLRKWSAQLPGITADKELAETRGGQQRGHFGAGTDWWHSISVRHDRTSGEYVFDDDARRARGQLSREPIDRQFVDHFVDRIVGTTRFDDDATGGAQRALFEMLLPRELKERAPDSDKLRLILDEDTARIPWEMLVDGWVPGNEPLVVSKQMIRRLSIDQFRHAPEPARGRSVLVVGDPPSGGDYPPLPAAREEARAVLTAFENRGGYEVVARIADDETATDGTDMAFAIVKALYSREFRVLHFAAHGSYHRHTDASDGGHEDKCKSSEGEGMVIGEGMHLTPALVQKMRKTPALVFLNCCHLGMIERRERGPAVRFNRIAANLATEFIRMGAQAVVAAGWAIEDEPAADFARVFHERMLENATLAEAITAARHHTHARYPGSNTFGAYQCWGDPEFRLDPRTGSHGANDDPLHHASPQGYLLDANNIRSQALSASERHREALEHGARRLLRSMIAQYGDPWQSPERGDTPWRGLHVSALASLGRAFGELGDMPEAIRLLRTASRLDTSALAFVDLEQLASFECRLATHRVDADSLTPHHDDERNEAEFGSPRALLRTGRERLDLVLRHYRASGRRHGQREILCLVGSGAKREAMLIRKPTRPGSGTSLHVALREMRHHYGAGWSGAPVEADGDATIETYIEAAARNGEKPDDYAFGNFALACIVLRWHEEDTVDWSDAFADRIREYTREALDQKARASDFWEATRGMESLMLQYLDDDLADRVGLLPAADMTGGGSGGDQEGGDTHRHALERAIADVKAHFRKINSRFGSVRQWTSVDDNLAFVKNMLEKKPTPRRDPLDEVRLKGIEEVRATIRELVRHHTRTDGA